MHLENAVATSLFDLSNYINLLMNGLIEKLVIGMDII